MLSPALSKTPLRSFSVGARLPRLGVESAQIITSRALRRSHSSKRKLMGLYVHNHATKTWAPTPVRCRLAALPCGRASDTESITAPRLCYRRPRQFHLSESSSRVRVRSESGMKAHADHRQLAHLRPAKFAALFGIARCGDEPPDVASVDIRNARR